MQKHKKRISILTKSEINELYQTPSFNPVERAEFFSLDIELKKEVDKIINIESRVYLILIIGYFRYKPVLPELTSKNVKGDVKYIIQTYYKNESTNINLNIPKSTKSRLVKRMLYTLGFEQLTPSIKCELSERLNDVATICMEPKYIFDELLAFLGQRRIALPGYSTVQKLVSEALNFERKRTVNCIFGNGANYGVHRMASASDRSIGILRDVNDKFIRPDTTGIANTVVSDAIANLSVYKYWTINEESPFGSVDGQKHTCRINTFKARFSAKYFRKGKGVSAMTLVSNHVPLATVVISPNEYEGHFAFDLLYNNTSEIQPKSLATDNHGVNNVNFAILDIFGYQFSPRYAKFKKVFNELFEVILEDDQLIIRLKKQFNIKLIAQEWENIQHIICSLSRKTTVQSTVVKKLSNAKRSGKTLAALREYDRIIKCIYVLDYADNKTLRQFVQQALNRGEAYHQLRRAIASVNGNQFRGGDDYQIDQWNDCARLIANCVIYYNSAILSGLVDKFEKENNKKAIDVLANLSPVAWRHILLGGNYSFEDQVAITNLDSLLEGVDPLSDEDDMEYEKNN
ncbi:Tn3 family transposase [Salmonella enterica subsp. diarizonae]|nr:Tn3 family transposase [Salmonella enterica subsp. diarizonae]